MTIEMTSDAGLMVRNNVGIVGGLSETVSVNVRGKAWREIGQLVQDKAWNVPTLLCANVESTVKRIADYHLPVAEFLHCFVKKRVSVNARHPVAEKTVPLIWLVQEAQHDDAKDPSRFSDKF